MKHVQIYTDPNAKPMSKTTKYVLITLGTLFALAYIYAQIVNLFFLNRYQKMYVAKEGVAIYESESYESKKLMELELWKKVMVPKKGSDWVEVDKPVHGFVPRSDLVTHDGMNVERIKRGLAPKQSMM